MKNVKRSYEERQTLRTITFLQWMVKVHAFEYTIRIRECLTGKIKLRRNKQANSE